MCWAALVDTDEWIKLSVAKMWHVEHSDVLGLTLGSDDINIVVVQWPPESISRETTARCRCLLQRWSWLLPINDTEVRPRHTAQRHTASTDWLTHSLSAEPTHRLYSRRQILFLWSHQTQLSWAGLVLQLDVVSLALSDLLEQVIVTDLSSSFPAQIYMSEVFTSLSVLLPYRSLVSC